MQAERVCASAQLRVQLLELLALVRPQHLTSSCTTTGGQLVRIVAADPAGNFVVVWGGSQGGSFQASSASASPAPAPRSVPSSA